MQKQECDEKTSLLPSTQDLNNLNQPHNVNDWKEVSSTFQISKKTILFYSTSIVLLFFYIIFDVLSTLYFKKTLNLLYQYPFLASELNYIITGVMFFIGHIIYSEIYYPYFVSITNRKGHSKENMKTNVMDDNCRYHHTKIYTIHYINISICNIFETLFQIVGSNGMGKGSGTLMVVLAQINIPLSVLCTLLIFRVRYNMLQWCGVACILLGIFIVVILPLIVQAIVNSEEHGKEQGTIWNGRTLFYGGIFVLSCFFSVGQRVYEQYLFRKISLKQRERTVEEEKVKSIQSILLGNNNNSINSTSNNYSEQEENGSKHKKLMNKKRFKHAPLNVYTLGFYERVYELGLNTLVMFPVYYIFINQYSDVNQFILGMNVAFNNVLFGDRQGWVTVVVFNFFSYVWLQLRLLCVKYINADITFFANAFAFPFCTLIFALPFMKFLISEQSTITPYHIVAIIVLFIGLLLYGVGERRNKK